MANLCPVCQKDDLVQRVKTLVASGQSSGTLSGPSGGVTYSGGKWGGVGGFSTLSGSTSTNLAKVLTPPTQPKRDRATFRTGCGYFLLFGFVSSIVIYCVTAFSPGIMQEAGSKFMFIFTSVLLAVVGGLAFGGPGLLLVISGARKRKLSNEQYPAAMAKWEKAMRCWQRLYFCHRDGIVFDPETNESCEPSQIQAFIYR